MAEDELGVCLRWPESTSRLEIEYFSEEPLFETRGDQEIEPIFHTPPTGRLPRQQLLQLRPRHSTW